MCDTNCFKIKPIDANLEFNCLKPYIKIIINIIDKKSYIYLVKRFSRTVKEQCRYISYSLPFSFILVLLTVDIMCNAITNLNIFL